MSTKTRTTLKQLVVAVCIAAVLIVVVVLFISSQAPETKPGVGIERPPIVLPKISLAGDGEDQQKPDEQVEKKDAHAINSEKKKDTVKAPDKTKSEKKKALTIKKPTRKKKVVKQSTMQKVENKKTVVDTYGSGLKIKFKNLESLQRLVTNDHVHLVLEYGDGTRFLLPEELQDEKVVMNVPAETFKKWLEEGRVSELEPTEELMNRMKVHRKNVRYLAVLSDDLRSNIAVEANRAGANLERSIMVIDENKGQSVVSVLLPRR